MSVVGGGVPIHYSTCVRKKLQVNKNLLSKMCEATQFKWTVDKE